ncbi:hypothetical protein C8Q79DRAFT_970713 [Trametes meyenii]|nr:hypothetical protein C8Q79DRAFT_970713 [Trametes meyenii]
MDREALKKLKRTDLQKLAKVRQLLRPVHLQPLWLSPHPASSLLLFSATESERTRRQTQSSMGSSKRTPLSHSESLVVILTVAMRAQATPSMYSIPPTSELEAISRKVLRGTAFGGARKQTVPQAESSSLRRSPRKSSANDAPAPNPEAAPPAASQDVQCPSSSPKEASGRRNQPSNDPRLQSGRNGSPKSSAVSPRPCETRPPSARLDNATTADNGSNAAASVVVGPHQVGDKSVPADTVEPAVVQPSLAQFMWRPPQSTANPTGVEPRLCKSLITAPSLSQRLTTHRRATRPSRSIPLPWCR